MFMRILRQYMLGHNGNNLLLQERVIPSMTISSKGKEYFYKSFKCLNVYYKK